MSDVAVPTSTGSWPRAAVLLPGLALLGFVFAVGWYGRAHGNLGMPWAPFFLYPHTRISWWAVPGLLAVVGSVAAAPRVFSVRSVRGFMAASFALALVARLGVNVIRSGPHGFIAPFVGFEGGQEYLTTVKRVTHDPLVFLRHFAHLVPNLPTHSAGHPPGPSLIAILLNDAGLGGPWPLAVLVIAVGTLAVPLTYLLGGALGLEDAALRLTALMAALAPAAVIESVTSMDAVFATLAVGTLVVILHGRYWLGGAMVWLCSFMSYALAAVPVWAVLVIWRQRSLREAVRINHPRRRRYDRAHAGGPLRVRVQPHRRVSGHQPPLSVRTGERCDAPAGELLAVRRYRSVSVRPRCARGARPGSRACRPQSRSLGACGSGAARGRRRVHQGRGGTHLALSDPAGGTGRRTLPAALPGSDRRRRRDTLGAGRDDRNLRIDHMVTPTPRILVVDDEPVVRDVLSRYLEREGFEVSVAADGPEALECVRRTEPQVVST